MLLCRLVLCMSFASQTHVEKKKRRNISFYLADDQQRYDQYVAASYTPVPGVIRTVGTLALFVQFCSPAKDT